VEEFENEVSLSGNLTEKPVFVEAGHRRFLRARLAQSWVYDTQGQVVSHRQFFSLVFFKGSEHIAQYYEKGDNIHVVGMIIRRAVRKTAAEIDDSDKNLVLEIHVHKTHLIGKLRERGATAAEELPHQSVVQRSRGATEVPPFLKEALGDWPL
jgi:single-stranded DNA-binding protein